MDSNPEVTCNSWDTSGVKASVTHSPLPWQDKISLSQEARTTKFHPKACASLCKNSEGPVLLGNESSFWTGEVDATSEQENTGWHGKGEIHQVLWRKISSNMELGSTSEYTFRNCNAQSNQHEGRSVSIMTQTEFTNTGTLILYFSWVIMPREYAHLDLISL